MNEQNVVAIILSLVGIASTLAGAFVWQNRKMMTQIVGTTEFLKMGTMSKHEENKALQRQIIESGEKFHRSTEEFTAVVKTFQERMAPDISIIKNNTETLVMRGVGAAIRRRRK
jgi:hypothetical protein